MGDIFENRKNAVFQDEVVAVLKPLLATLYKDGDFDAARRALTRVREINATNLFVNAHWTRAVWLSESMTIAARRTSIIEMLDRMRAGDAVSHETSEETDDRIFRFLADSFHQLGDHAEASRWLGKTAVPADAGEAGSAWAAGWRAMVAALEQGEGRNITGKPLKVGLALSGGGFRASFYHLGVLAALAEMDVLRDVEVISAVSGGSIVGVHYYLELKRMLESTPDHMISKADYIAVVQQVQRDFLDGVGENIRTLAFASFRENLKMIFSKAYSRSHRLGHLYEEILYSRVMDRNDKDPASPRFMRELLIQPRTAGGFAEENFKPRYSNWRRRAKVPNLLINATSLNTGHNWRFTARSMGESETLIRKRQTAGHRGDVDKNAMYRPLRYADAPSDDLRNYRLGYAVAASACVPGLFEPLAIAGLYPDRMVRLVDGGVHDNQGVAGLLDEGCNFVLCSDASGQMHDEHRPGSGLVGVLKRASGITMDRVREAEFQELLDRLDATDAGERLEGLLFVHLKKDFPPEIVDWQERTSSFEKDPTQRLPYGIDLEIQKRIAALRTDLDAFSDIEACSLMASGYLMTRQEVLEIQKRRDNAGKTGPWGGYDLTARSLSENSDVHDHSAVAGSDWRFSLLIKRFFEDAPGSYPHRELSRHLEAGAAKAFKILILDKGLQVAAVAAFGLVFFGLLAMAKSMWDHSLIHVTVGGGLTTLLLIAVLAAAPSLKWLFPSRQAGGIIRKAAIALAGSFLAKAHLRWFNRRFLDRGRG